MAEYILYSKEQKKEKVPFCIESKEAKEGSIGLYYIDIRERVEWVTSHKKKSAPSRPPAPLLCVQKDIEIAGESVLYYLYMPRKKKREENILCYIYTMDEFNAQLD